MKLKFKKYKYQTDAVNAVVDCFKGQPKSDGVGYRVDMGEHTGQILNEYGFKNPPVAISPEDLLKNIRDVQAKPCNGSLPKSDGLEQPKQTFATGCKINLDIEMETGTGKTYCYLKTMYELNRQYGWNKFIIVVPSIAIREGVAKSIEYMQDHFLDEYHKSIRSFIYNSKTLHNLDTFSTDNGLNVMIVNVQAFNASGADNRRIYEELDAFGSRRPIDVIKANNPILILDEPQKMEGNATIKSFSEFNALMMLRYSATHKTKHNKIYRLDAIDAYNQKLVKKINVRGITVKGQSGNTAYINTGSFNICTDKAPTVNISFEQKLMSGTTKKISKKLDKGSNLYKLSNELTAYKDGYVITDIDAHKNKIIFENGIEMSATEVIGDSDEEDIRRIQIQQTIQSHFDKEEQLFNQGIKCLSLFFIDEVAKYRLYDEENNELLGEYAQIFEEEYKNILNEKLSLEPTEYQEYLKSTCSDIPSVHNGYFSIDKKTKRMIDPAIEGRGESKGEAKDVDAYDLILKDKERLLSFEEPTKFIFSHSALSEGWDNPNVFTICTLKNANSEIRRRQEIGRGLRLCVNKNGERQDDPSTVHKTNILTVVPSESYENFAKGLQTEIRESISERPNKADEKYFQQKIIFDSDNNEKVVDEAMAKEIYRYLLKNDYTDNNDLITDVYKEARNNSELSELPETLQPYQEDIIKLIDSVYDTSVGLEIGNANTQPSLKPNKNLDRDEFLKLWNKINNKSAYIVDFDTSELIDKSIKHIDDKLFVTELKYEITVANQKSSMDYSDLTSGEMMKKDKTSRQKKTLYANSTVQYDLLEQVSKNTGLTRHTVATILSKINSAMFSAYKKNPEEFISNVSRLINEQKATTIIEKITYNLTEDKFELEDIFTAEDFDMTKHLKVEKHVYDYLKTDSKTEKAFAEKMDIADEVVVYSKLPRGFYIPTPVGNYNPDWAIAFKEGAVKHIFFVAETKGSMRSMDLREIEQSRIECAKKYFESISQDNVKYDVVDTYESMMKMIVN